MRKLWLEKMTEIARPVLDALAEERLHKSIPTDFHNDRSDYILLEAFGRTASGIAPWLEAEVNDREERLLQAQLREKMKKAIENATNPLSPDYMNWGDKGGQPLVDAAFLSQAIVSAPKAMYFSLDDTVKKRLADCLKKSRSINPPQCNWLFFSAMTEAALFVMGEEYSLAPVIRATDTFENWYAGDGTFCDGEYFHWDYYNSLVIHPMYIDILRAFGSTLPDYEKLYGKELSRARRYTEILEQLINPDGTYAVFGRSSVYRFGSFGLLSQAVLQEFLPERLSLGQVKGALNAVIKKVCENPRMLDENGFLTPGVYGLQPSMAEEYINVGSLYLCERIFLPLGLKEDHPFWQCPEEDWTSKKIWSGQDVVRDHSRD